MNVSIPAKIIKGRLELDLEDVYNNPKKYFPNLSAEEAYYYTKLIERVYKSKIRKKFAEANNIELSIRGQTTNRVLLQVQTAKADYRDAKFSKLTHSDIDMIVEMQEMFAELNDVAMPNTVRSASFFPTFISANHVNALKQLVGYHELQEDDYKNTLSGETQYYLKATALNRPEVIGRIKYDLYAITNKEAYDLIFGTSRDYDSIMDKIQQSELCQKLYAILEPISRGIETAPVIGNLVRFIDGLGTDKELTEKNESLVKENIALKTELENSENENTKLKAKLFDMSENLATYMMDNTELKKKVYELQKEINSIEESR